MSISRSDVETFTAVAQANVASGTQEENAAEIQAREDRELLAVLVAPTTANATVEVSWSSEQQLDQETTVESASGVIAATRPDDGDTAFQDAALYVELPEKQNWSAGEEVHFHVNNFSASEEQFRLILYYVPIGEPQVLRG